MRGYCGIGIENGKAEVNMGTLLFLPEIFYGTFQSVNIVTKMSQTQVARVA